METRGQATGRPDAQAKMIEKLVEALARMGRRHERRSRDFDVPTYMGKGDVELFIRQFMDAVEANEWPRGAGLLHLQKALEKEATDCGRAEDMEGIFTSLNVRIQRTSCLFNQTLFY